MSTKHIDGKAFAQSMRDRLKQQVTQLKDEYDITPGLAVVLVGDDPASAVYVGNKHKQTVECGMQSFTHRLDASVSEQALLELIDQLNANPQVNGILVQLPLPPHINTQRVLCHIAPLKDVDGFHPENVGRLMIGNAMLVPCTPLGCLLLLKHYVGDLTGKHAVIIGRSTIVGKPMAQLLLAENMTVTIAHSKTQAIESVCRLADVVVAAVGVPKLVKKEWLKSGAVVIDVGINRIEDPSISGNRLVGDVDYEDVQETVSMITPVPGGVGPMTIACLLRNTLKATYLQSGLILPDLLK